MFADFIITNISYLVNTSNYCPVTIMRKFVQLKRHFHKATIFPGDRLHRKILARCQERW